MCVIMLADEGHRPTEKMVEEAWKSNSHGGGIGYREKGADGEPEVVWKKGLDLQQMKEFCATLEFPFVAHFRKESSGGKCNELTHPFPILTDAGNELEGRGKYDILFQNGTWKEWWAHLFQTAAHMDNPNFPPGKEWSDTRAMAWLICVTGPNLLDAIKQKAVVFGPTTYQVFEGPDGWELVNDVWCSNAKFWKPQSQHQSNFSSTQSTTQQTGHGSVVDLTKMCRDRNCAKTFGIIDGYCDDHKNQRRTERRALPPSGGTFCHECRKFIYVNQEHLANCTKRSDKLVCDTCQITLGLGYQHMEGCPEANPLLSTKDAEQARSQFKDPFFLLTVAEKWHQQPGGLAKNELKRVWKRITGADRNVSLLDSFHKNRETLKEAPAPIVH
jgi:hypothetical protein